MARDGQAGKAAKLWLRQQTRLARRHQWPVVALGLASILTAIGQAACAGLVLTAALGRPVRATILSGAAAGTALAPLACFALLALARAVLSFFAERAAFTAGAAARRRIRTDALGRLLHAGPSALRDAHSGELAALVVERVDALDGLFSRWAPSAVLAVAGPVLVALAVLLADPFAALVLVVGGLCVPLGMALAGIGAASASRRQFVALARLQARFVDRVRGISTIVLAGRADAEAGRLQHSADELRRRTMRVLRVAFLSSAALDLALAGALVLLAIRYGRDLAAGALYSPATALTVLLLVPEFFAPLRSFAAAYQDRLHAVGAAGALVALPQPGGKPDAPANVRTVTASGVAVAFENVGLTWDAARGPALNGLSFRVPAGETLILAGPSGAGKSTAIEILLGFVRPDQGRVTINGADIAELVPQALSRMTAWIGQRPVLFAGSIRDNIRFGRPEAADGEVEDAARSARVLEFASLLPDGLDVRVGEGGYGLSGGQAQRVAIARAFLKNAPLLLLDEPTAHLDPATESEVLDSLRRLAIGRTVILATHSAAAQAFGGRRLDLRAGQAVPARGAA
jgi:ATP-binding cassette subfamily C protein CydD